MVNHGFWKNLPKPFWIMAPMYDVTDSAFRRIIASQGKPSVFFTEFVSADGIMSVGLEKIMKNLIFDESERPLVAQIFGKNPENFYKASKYLIEELKFDGIDINMGCPDKNHCKTGACAALIDNPNLAKELVAAAKEGAGDKPVSVKTRLGTSKITIEDWIVNLLETEPAVITIHARTKKEMSKVPAHWEYVKRCVEIRNEMKSETYIAGNGDVQSIADAKSKVQEFGVDGVMLGRAIFGNPWLFNENVKKEELSADVILETLYQHTKLFEELFTGKRNFLLMRKHFASYVSALPNAKRLKEALMEVSSSEDLNNVRNKYLSGQIA